MLEEIMPMHEQTAYQPGVTVPIDNSAMLPLNGNAATVVVGNPSIAEVTVQNGNLLFILGRNFGTTNVIALDNQNNEIANIPISVTANVPHHMTLYRGAAQVSYSCASRCERSLTPGDVGDEYDTAQTQVKAKLSIGKGASGQQ
jgi:Flp pilus assembly secretin CpaC